MADEYCLCHSLSFNISETKHVIENLTTDIIITSKVLNDKPNNYTGCIKKKVIELWRAIWRSIFNIRQLLNEVE